MRLLLIEDSEKLQFHLGEGLKKLGYEMQIAGNGQEGMWLAQTQDYDVILLDLMLPGMDGMSILSRLRKLGKDTPVLILAAKDQVANRVQGLRAGADDYLVKPSISKGPIFPSIASSIAAAASLRHRRLMC